jgi:hypothetical protein
MSLYDHFTMTVTHVTVTWEIYEPVRSSPTHWFFQNSGLLLPLPTKDIVYKKYESATLKFSRKTTFNH